MKGGNSDSKGPEPQGYDYENVGQYGSVNLKGGKPKKRSSGKGKRKSPKFEEFDFQKEWKEFEESYNQKYGGASKTKAKKTKKPAKKASSSTKKPAKKATKRKTSQRGGDDPAATSLPAQMFDEKETMSSTSTGPFQSAYGTIKVDGLDRNLAAYPNSSGQQTGGAKKKKASKVKKSKTTTKTTKPKKDSKKKDTKKTKATGKKVSVLDKIKKFFAM